MPQPPLRPDQSIRCVQCGAWMTGEGGKKTHNRDVHGLKAGYANKGRVVRRGRIKLTGQSHTL